MNEQFDLPLYTSAEIGKRIILNESQKDAIRSITLSIEEVDKEIRSAAIPDVIKTLESGHPLNRLITDINGEITGYIACMDFSPHEAYIKYLGTTKQTGRNLLREIPSFIEYAQKAGYTKLSFHGWNDRLNHILTRYGFKQIRTDELLTFQIGFYEKTLTQANVVQPKDLEVADNTVFQVLSQRLIDNPDIEFGKFQQDILKLKLVRHFQKSKKEASAIDVNTLYDAIIESPKFINTEKGSLHHLLETHEVKTLQKIAEIRKRRAEVGDKTGNPYENLFATRSGEYYVARLLNMPHLEAESAYMSHCVGTSDSYVNQIKRGDIEILSFRNMPKINPETQKLEGDTPIITLEYNLKTKTIEQVKKQNDAYLSSSDPYYHDFIDALKQLRTTTTDVGGLRDFTKISSSELEEIKVKDYHILTENGEVPFRDIDLEAEPFILKAGKLLIALDTPKEDIAKITQIVERNAQHETVTAGGITGTEYGEMLRQKGINVSDYANHFLKSSEFQTLQSPEEMDLIELTVGDLGFSEKPTTEEIYQQARLLGLELCPPELAAAYLLQHDSNLRLYDWKYVGMEPLTDSDGDPHVFALDHNDDGCWLHAYLARPEDRWDLGGRFLFRSRKLDS